ncbi:25S rRNA (adenine645-N1)-methyltransferase [Varicellaria rhodocarpa]|nr:25S rRNA (adenine645-N1)-methyltransferase [Varicellaria rhodocarpa]
MFAVPGWSVSAETLRPQTQLTSRKSLESVPEVSKSPSEKENSSKKRKRGSNSTATVTDQNFADLWQKHIEHKSPLNSSSDGPSKGKERKRQRKKGPKVGNEDTVGRDGGDQIGNVQADGKEQYLKRKTLKEKRREKKAQLQANGEIPPSRPTQNTQSSQVQENPGNSTSLSEQQSDMIDEKTIAALPPSSKLTPLQSVMRQKLISARFRHLNQTLYNTPSLSSFELFKQNPTFFTEYHEGFQRQVEAWPENPVEGFIQWIKKGASANEAGTNLLSQKTEFKKNKKSKKPSLPVLEQPLDPSVSPLPHHPATHVSTIADLGCGTAILSRNLSPLAKTLKLKIYSYDLCAPYPCITVADIRSIPLPDSSVDVAIFCLALMGTNWLEFVEEAWRILKWKGECWVGEVGSRFVSPAGMRKGRVAHSVGNRTKGGGKKKDEKRKAEEDLSDDDEIDLDAEFTPITPAATSIQMTTDLAPFISVLRTRGFKLIGEPELGNKMFVRMRFVKALTPIRGKHVPAIQKEQEGKRPRFLEKEKGSEDVGPEEEGKVLKGCVYKNR